jgi:cytochrome b involved in lipid metabolism
VNGRAYNLTSYLRLHPGGINLIARLAGSDATRDFEALFHSMKARQILDFYYIGDMHVC